MGLVVLLLLGVGVLVTLRLSRRPLRSTAWLLLRSLFPSWRFFEAVEPGPADPASRAASTASRQHGAVGDREPGESGAPQEA